MKKVLAITMMMLFAFIAGTQFSNTGKAAAQQAYYYGGKVQLSDGTPSHTKIFQFAVVPTDGTNYIRVSVFDKDGNDLGTPIRFKMSNSGGRVAADLPSVSDSSFITVDGHITNG